MVRHIVRQRRNARAIRGRYGRNFDNMRAAALMGRAGLAWLANRRRQQRGTWFRTPFYDPQRKFTDSRNAFRPGGPSLHYKPPPRMALAKDRRFLSKKEKEDLHRYHVKFPVTEHMKVILGNQTAPASADTPLGPQWTRSTEVAVDSVTNEYTNVAGFVVALTKLRGTDQLPAGQGNVAANTAGPTSSNYGFNNLLWDIKSDSSQMNGCAHNYTLTGVRAHIDTDYLIAGFRGSITIGGMQQSCDQRVYMQIVRKFDLPSSVEHIPSTDFKELVNGQMLPNNQHWSLLWKKSFVLKGRAAGSARISQEHVKFDLPVNYMRSKTKKISTAASNTLYGQQLSYAYKNTEEMYNQCYLVITTRPLTAINQEAINAYGAAVGGVTSIHPAVTQGGGRMAPKIGIKGWVKTDYRFRNPRVAPGATAGSAPSEDD